MFTLYTEATDDLLLALVKKSNRLVSAQKSLTISVGILVLVQTRLK